MAKTHPINYCLIIGIIFLSATKLQLGQTPITLGSSVLLLYGLLAFCIGVKMTPPLKLFLTLFIIVAFCLMAGLLINKYTLHNINPTTWRDIVSYGFILFIIITLNCEKLDLDTCIKIASIMIPILYLLFIPSLHYWYQHDRFSGLSKNPNQLAFAFLAIPLILIYFVRGANKIMKILMTISFFTCVILSYLTFTHALLVAWSVTIAVCIICFSIKYLYQISLSALFWTIITIASIAFIIIVIYTVHHFYQTIHLFKLTHAEPNIRLHLWHQGLALIHKSPAVGFGPGSFLCPSTCHHPGQYEAHNIFIDLLLQGGLISVLTFIYFLCNIVKQSIKTHLFFLIVISVLTFSLFHYTLRQPILWIYFFWIYQKGMEHSSDKRSLTEGKIEKRAFIHEKDFTHATLPHKLFRLKNSETQK